MNQNAAEALRQKLETLDAQTIDPDFQPEELWDTLRQKLDEDKPRKRIPLLWYWSYAAAFLLLGSLLTFWILQTRPTTTPTVATNHATPRIVPKTVKPEPTYPLTTPTVSSDPLDTQASVPEKNIAKTQVPSREDSFPERIQEVIPAPSIPEVPVIAQQKVEEHATSSTPTVAPATQKPRAPYLLDAAPQETIVVNEKAHTPDRKIHFPLSPEYLSTQTAFHAPASVFQGLRK